MGSQEAISQQPSATSGSRWEAAIGSEWRRERRHALVLAAVFAAAMIALFTLAGCGEVTVPNPYSDAREPVTLAQLDREADRQVAEAKAEAEAAAKSADRAAREELAELTNFRLDAEADLELAMATLRSQFAKADRAVDLKLTALQGDLEGALDAASRNFASKTSEIGSLRSAAAERIAAIEAQRGMIGDTIGGLAANPLVQSIPYAGVALSLIGNIYQSVTGSRRREQAALTTRSEADKAYDDGYKAALEAQSRTDNAWDEASVKSQFNTLLAAVIGRGQDAHATQKTPPSNVAGAAAGTGTDAIPAAA